VAEDEKPSEPAETDEEAPVSRYVMPLGPRVLVKLLPGDSRTAAGLFLPPGAKEAAAEWVELLLDGGDEAACGGVGVGRSVGLAGGGAFELVVVKEEHAVEAWSPAVGRC